MSQREINVERSTSTAHRLAEYDGGCNYLHGHNMKWDVDMTVSMDHTGKDNMPIDFKDVSSLIDVTDHAIILSEEDPLLEALFGEEVDPEYMTSMWDDGSYRITGDGVLGDALILPSGDPTCEYLTEWMAKRLYNVGDYVSSVTVACSETEKYTMEYTYPE